MEDEGKLSLAAALRRQGAGGTGIVKAILRRQQPPAQK